MQRIKLSEEGVLALIRGDKVCVNEEVTLVPPSYKEYFLTASQMERIENALISHGLDEILDTLKDIKK